MLRCCSSVVLLFAIIIGMALFSLERRATHFFDQDFMQSSIKTSAGNVDLPILYYDGSLVGAFYLVDPQAAQALLPEGTEPLLLPWPISKAIAGIFMFQYRNTTIGEYGEMGLTIQARRIGSGATLLGYSWDLLSHMYHLPWMLSLFSQETTGLYVVTLPVSTKEAMAAGREIWGYNKYLANFDSDFSTPQKMSFSLVGEFKMELSAPSIPNSLAGLPFLTYTVQNGALVRTVVEVGHKVSWGFSSFSLDISGAGETADKMKALGMDKMGPVAAFRTDTLKAHLPAGKVLN